MARQLFRVLVAIGLPVALVLSPLAPVTDGPGAAVATSADPDAPVGDEVPEEQVPADEQTAPVVGLSAPATAYVGAVARISGTVSDPGGDSFRPVILTRAGDDRPLGTVTPADDGTFGLDVTVVAGASTYRATYADGLAHADISMSGVAAPAALSFTAPSRLVDETSAAVGVRWHTVDGRPVTGTVRLEYLVDGAYKLYENIAVRDGKGSTSITPRHTRRLRVAAPATELTLRQTTATRTMKNVPPGKVWKLSPAPSHKTPSQTRSGLGSGANVKISRLTSARMAAMKGRSWRAGCMSRGKLRLVEVNYWGFDGYRHRGEIIVHESVAARTGRAFTDLYDKRYPIYRMYAVDRFGYSKKLRGADDYKSMRAGNTSGFNCRGVVGHPSVRSPHSHGRSIDINPWWNPYHSRTGIVPNTVWDKRTSPSQVLYRSRSNGVVTIMRKHGFRWLGNHDKHHFDG